MSFLLKNCHAVILAGGEGTRFAPLSTPDLPKQFLPITHSRGSMIQETFFRVDSLIPDENIHVSTNIKYLSLVKAQLPRVPEQNVVGEPLKKNTAPAIAFLAYKIFMRDPRSILLFLPSDHFVFNGERARDMLVQAFQLAHGQDVLVTFGIPPRFPSSDYGYIQCGSQTQNDPACFDVLQFVEKPDKERAQLYLESKNYFWNSGIFIWKSAVVLQAFKKYLPELFDLLAPLSLQDLENPDALFRFFEKAPSISIDYALMEKARNVKMIPFDAGWSDVGTWQGLKQLSLDYPLDLPPNVKKYLV